MRFLRPLTAILLVSLPALAAKRPALQIGLAETSFDFKDYCFPSGLHLTFQIDRSLPLWSISSVVDAGAAADPPGMEGLAHLAEHLWFRMPHAGLGRVDELEDRSGAWMNAFTRKDFTLYSTAAPSRYARILLELEAARLDDPLRQVTQQMLDVEREVVRSERRQGHEGAGWSGTGVLEGALFPAPHPYHRPVIGSHDSLDAIGLDDIRDWAKANYTPENATIVVVGDTDPDNISTMLAGLPLELVAGDDPSDGPIRPVECPVRNPAEAPAPPDPDPEAVGVVLDAPAAVDEPHLRLGWTLPGGTGPQQILGRYTAAELQRLFDSLLAHDFDATTSCYFRERRQAGAIVCTITTEEPQPADKMLKLVNKVVRGSTTLGHRVNDRWLRLSMSGRLFRGAEDSTGFTGSRATELAMFSHETGSLDRYSAGFQWLMETNVAMLGSWASPWITPERMVAVQVRPFTEAEQAASIARGREVASIDHPGVPAPHPDELDAAYLRGQTVLPDYSRAQTATLDNGLEVIALPFGTMPVVRAAIVLPGGAATEPIDGLDSMTWKVTKSLGRTVDDMSLEKAPMSIAGRWSVLRRGDYRSYAISAASGSLEAALYLLATRMKTADALLEGKFDLISDMQEKRAEDEQEPDLRAREAMNARLYVDHPAGQAPDHDTLEAMKELKASDVTAWFGRLYRPEQATLLIVGALDPTEALAHAETWFSSWKVRPAKGPEPVAPPPATPPEVRQVLVVPDPSAVQAHVIVACHLAGTEATDHPAQSLASGYVTGHMTRVLRKERGKTYGVSYSIRRSPGGARIVRVSTSVELGSAGVALQTQEEAARRIAAGEVSATSLAATRLDLARSQVRYLQNTDQILRDLIRTVATGLPYDWRSGYPDRLATVDSAALATTMKPCAGREIVTIRGPEDAVRADLDGAGIAYEFLRTD